MLLFCISIADNSSPDPQPEDTAMEVQPSSEGPSDILRGIIYAIIISLIDTADIADTSDTADTSDVSKEKQVDGERPLRKSIIILIFFQVQ